MVGAGAHDMINATPSARFRFTRAPAMTRSPRHRLLRIFIPTIVLASAAFAGMAQPPKDKEDPKAPAQKNAGSEVEDPRGRVKKKVVVDDEPVTRKSTEAPVGSPPHVRLDELVRCRRGNARPRAQVALRQARRTVRSRRGAKRRHARLAGARPQGRMARRSRPRAARQRGPAAGRPLRQDGGRADDRVLRGDGHRRCREPREAGGGGLLRARSFRRGREAPGGGPPLPRVCPRALVPQPQGPDPQRQGVGRAPHFAREQAPDRANRLSPRRPCREGQRPHSRPQHASHERLPEGRRCREGGRHRSHRRGRTATSVRQSLR